VDAIVRDSHGPIAGLTRDDFTVLDNGKPQKIAVFSVRSSRNPEVPVAPLPPGAVSSRLNRRGETPASATILLIDRQNTPVSDQAYANRKIVKFLETRGNKDSLGIYILGNTLRVVQDLTDDPERLDRALKSLKPQEAKGLTSDVKVDKNGDAITDAMLARSLEGLDDIILQTKATSLKDALTEIARHLAKVPGRKSLVWVSGSFPLFVRRATYNLDFTPEMQAAGKALNDANVAIYPVDARGLAGSLSVPGSVANAETGGGRGCNPALGECIMAGPGRMGEPTGLDTMNALASLTGGRAFYNTNGIEDSIAKAVEDAEITYTLGFYPSSENLDGTYHKLTVKMSRRVGSVHHRGGYIASKAMAGADQGRASRICCGIHSMRPKSACLQRRRPTRRSLDRSMCE
jgi:VWFA-related protein